MKKLLSGLLCLVISLQSATLFANEVPQTSLQREAGIPVCDDFTEICSYVAQNITARELIAKINANLFPGSILSPSEGYITSDGLKKINFKINDQELKAKLIASIALFDTLEEFDPSDLIMLTTDIYSLSEGALSHIQANANVSADPTNPATEIADWVVTSSLGGPTGVALKLGTNLLSSLLGSNKVKEESSKVTTISQLIPNQAGINYSNTSKIYISPQGSGVVKEEQAGLTVGGTVSISAGDNDLILVKDFNLTYGVVENVLAGERVNILSINNPQLYLVKGMSSLVVSSVTIDQTSKTEYSALSFGKEKGKVLNKLMIVTKAEAISFKNFVQEMKKLRELELHKQFSKEDVAKLPTSNIELKDVLKHITPYAYFTTSGDRIMGFKLDAKDARTNNIAKNIKVTVKAKGILSSSMKQEVILPVENLMLSGLKFEPIPLKELNKSNVDIIVSLKEFNGGASVNKTLHYNPETNKFFE